jgi:hypothetical protein
MGWLFFFVIIIIFILGNSENRKRRWCNRKIISMKRILPIIFILFFLFSCNRNKTGLLLYGKWKVSQIGTQVARDTAGMDAFSKAMNSSFDKTAALSQALFLAELNGDEYEFKTDGDCNVYLAGMKMYSLNYKCSFDGKTIILDGEAIGVKKTYEVIFIDGKELVLKYSDGKQISFERETK